MIHSQSAETWEAEVTDLKRALTEAESRALLAVAREAELVGALNDIKVICHGMVSAATKRKDRRWLRVQEISETAISSTSPRAKQLLAIEAAARKVVKLWNTPNNDALYSAMSALDAALTTQPVDEEGK